jgi:hypothetical protein
VESISDGPPDLGFRGRWYTRGGNGSSGPGWPHHRPARLGVDPRPLWVSPPCCSSRLLLLATFVFWYYKNFWVFLWNSWSSEIWCLDSPFSSRILTLAASFSNDHQICKSRGNNISIISKYEIYQWITVKCDTK